SNAARPPFDDRRDVRGDVLIGVGVLRLQAARDGLEFRLRALQSLVGFDQAEGDPITIGANPCLAGVARDRSPTFSVSRIFEIGRQHADDGHARIAERLTDYARISAEAPLP